MFQENPKANLQLLAMVLEDLRRQGVDWQPNGDINTIDFMRNGRAVGHLYKDSYLNTQVAVDE